MKLNHNTTTKILVEGLKFCSDINGNHFGQGEKFIPKHAECKRCTCNSGRAENCIAIQCKIPTCQGFQRVPGKCCEFKCPSKGFTIKEKWTPGVLISLSIVIVLLLVVISILYKKKKGLTVKTKWSTSCTQNGGDIDSFIKRNSIPNNIRPTCLEMKKLEQIYSYECKLNENKQLLDRKDLPKTIDHDLNLFISNEKCCSSISEEKETDFTTVPLNNAFDV